MTTAALPSVAWIRLTVGDERIDISSAPGVHLRLIMEPVPDDRSFGLLDPPRPPAFRVAVDLIPTASTGESWAEAVAACEAQAARLATRLGVDAPLLEPLQEFSLDASLTGEGLPYNRVSIPRLTLKPSGPPQLNEDQPLPTVPVFAATARAGADGSTYVLTRQV